MQTDFEVAEIAFRVDIILISRGPTRAGGETRLVQNEMTQLSLTPTHSKNDLVWKLKLLTFIVKAILLRYTYSLIPPFCAFNPLKKQTVMETKTICLLIGFGLSSSI